MRHRRPFASQFSYSHLHFKEIYIGLGTFAKLRKAAISFVMSVCRAWNNSAPTGRISVKFDMGAFFDTLSRKFKFY